MLTLASWGFSARAGFEGDLPFPPPPPAAGESDSAVSDISHDSSGGGGGGGLSGVTGRGGASKYSAVNTSAGLPQVRVVFTVRLHASLVVWLRKGAKCQGVSLA